MDVLILDDERTSITLLDHYVRKLNYMPVRFSRAADALAWCTEHEPSAVIVDYMMPEIDGIEFTRRFRRLPGKADIPVLMVSAYRDPELIRLTRDAGVNNFLDKPVDAADLTAYVRNMIAIRAAQKRQAKNERVAAESRRSGPLSVAEPRYARVAPPLEITSAKTGLVMKGDSYVLTRRGEAELLGANTSLPSLALEVLVCMDGPTRLTTIEASMPYVPYDTLAQTIDFLLQNRLISYAPRPGELLHFDSADPITRQDTMTIEWVAQNASQSLTKYGYSVRIARRPDAAPKLPKDRAPIVLIVEDEPVLARFLVHFMKLDGFEVRLARDGATAFKLLGQQPGPELVLLDVTLPDVDGFEVLQKIRGEPILAHTRVLMLTSSATRESVMKGLSGGADGYLTKPLEAQVLTDAVRTIFGLNSPKPDVWKFAS